VTRLCFAIPGDLALPTGGYGYARHVIAGLPAAGVAVEVITLSPDFPAPTAETLDAALAAMAATPADAVLLIDGLAGGVLPAGHLAAIPRRKIALVHHPLAHETGIDPLRAAALHASEQAMLAVCDGVIATSQTTADALVAAFGVPAGKLSVAEPGTDPAPLAQGSGGPGLALLAVGAVVPRKGYDLLVAAVGNLVRQGLPLRLSIVGACDRAPAHAQDIAAAAAALPPGTITLAGAVDDATLAHAFDRTDLFVIASHYEGFGMGLTEAVARGLPLVSTTGGALARTFPPGCGIQVPPGDAAALAAAIAALAIDPTRRAAAAAASRAAAAHLTRWPETARIIAEAVRPRPEHTP
jgi:glycosyltransferase involved in cell wall biosynthesis